jgi:serine/threonine protein kinase
VAEGISYLHDQSIVHGDINWVNVFIDDTYTAKLADFGLAKLSETTTGRDTTTTGQKGTVAWMSPERHGFPSGAGAKLAKPMDVYSFGMLILSVGHRTFL